MRLKICALCLLGASITPSLMAVESPRYRLPHEVSHSRARLLAFSGITWKPSLMQTSKRSLALDKKIAPCLKANMRVSPPLERLDDSHENICTLLNFIGCITSACFMFIPFTASATPEVAKPQQGQVLFQARCAQCHAGIFFQSLN